MDLLENVNGSMRLILGGPFGEEPAELSDRRLDLFREHGGRIVETAHSYAGGAAEAVIGGWLRRRRCRDEIAVVDKVCHPSADGISRVCPEIVRREVTGSLKRLGLTTIDLVLLHRDDPAVAVQDLVGAFLDEVEAGRIRRFGVTNWPAGRLVRFVEAARQAGQSPIVSYQFSLAGRGRTRMAATRTRSRAPPIVRCDAGASSLRPVSALARRRSRWPGRCTSHCASGRPWDPRTSGNSPTRWQPAT
jgi:aryl-alcohol dehydrogenase-like predicted oxidoreductase